MYFSTRTLGLCLPQRVTVGRVLSVSHRSNNHEHGVIWGFKSVELGGVLQSVIQQVGASQKMCFAEQDLILLYTIL